MFISPSKVCYLLVDHLLLSATHNYRELHPAMTSGYTHLSPSWCEVFLGTYPIIQLQTRPHITMVT